MECVSSLQVEREYIPAPFSLPPAPPVPSAAQNPTVQVEVAVQFSVQFNSPDPLFLPPSLWLLPARRPILSSPLLPPPYYPPSLPLSLLLHSDSSSFLPLSFASYSLSLPSSLLFSSACSVLILLLLLLLHFFVITSSASTNIPPDRFNSTLQQIPLPLLFPHYLTPIFPGRWATATSYCLSAINYTVPSLPLRFRARPSCCCDRPNTLVYTPGSIGLSKR
ncbi:hypothetical protein BO85DRAFT_187768 [Aspergillus piperis CBS 112811]|uniref:Uncharacterized protein n=1 Tax=Aspergillus piperis CBS 112811 TaxID=1448313 RepID=A0A8G1VPS2_9EURO|nr:hypothetical protein BO85DRAFT_187768 [Aspergillus piperis CBS 112811]RAH61101.1 hypothetical protein BO85DRAFT_187768 [Aspergillus piperis CBS 112811]